MTIEEVQLYI